MTRKEKKIETSRNTIYTCDMHPSYLMYKNYMREYMNICDTKNNTIYQNQYIKYKLCLGIHYNVTVSCSTCRGFRNIFLEGAELAFALTHNSQFSMGMVVR